MCCKRSRGRHPVVRPERFQSKDPQRPMPRSSAICSCRSTLPLARSGPRAIAHTPRFSDQSELPALIDGLRPVDDGELTHDVAQVRFDRLLADEELLTDVAVG